MMKDIYGQRCLDAFQKCNHVGLWAKTFSDLLIGQGDWYSRKSNLIWKLKGTKFNRIFFQLYPKTLRTEEIESGLLLTPTVTDIGHRSDDAKQKRKEYRESIGRKTVPPGNLSEQVMGMLPTPVASDVEGGISDKRQMKNKNGRWVRVSDNTQTEFGAKLRDVAQMLPTPTTQEPESQCELTENGRRKTKDGKDSHSLNIGRMASMGMLPTPAARDHKGDRTLKDGKNITKSKQELGLSLEQSARILANKPNETHKNANLNPQFVAEMMGFPNKWTEKPFEEDAENSFDAVDFNKFPTSYPIVQEEFQPNIISHSRWRRESIKGYGNAVVPQVVLEIFKAIDKYENLKNENQ